MVFEEESKLRCVLHSQCPSHSQAWIREDAAAQGASRSAVGSGAAHVASFSRAHDDHALPCVQLLGCAGRGSGPRAPPVAALALALCSLPQAQHACVASSPPVPAQSLKDPIGRLQPSP
jgi:hypothetical protein